MIPVAVTAPILGLLASLSLTPLVTRLAIRLGWLDHPDGCRKLHSAPIPRIGGLAVFASFALASGILALLSPEAVSDGPGLTSGYRHLLLACGAVAMIGFIDDVVDVRPWAKILVQVFAAFYLYVNGYQIRLVTNPLGEPFALGHLALPLTVLWFIGMSNAFNLIDGLDGLAAGVAFFATGSFFIAAALNGNWSTAYLCAALGGALLGFLRYNFSPATIFLGDSGALFVGFALAAFAIAGSMKSSAAIAVAAPLLALALPIFDVMISMLRRIIRGSRLFDADREHIHHRLLHLGLTPRRAVILLYCVAALLASLSLVITVGSLAALLAVGIVVALLAWASLGRLGYAEFGELQRLLANRLVPDRRTMANNVYLMQFREALPRADSFAVAWDGLIEITSRLEGHRVELKLSGEYTRKISGLVSEGRSRYTFPVWSLSDADQSHLWSWSIPISGTQGKIGALVVDFDPGRRRLSFEPFHLLEAVTNEFSSALERFLVRGEPSLAGVEKS